MREWEAGEWSADPLELLRAVHAAWQATQPPADEDALIARILAAPPLWPRRPSCRRHHHGDGPVGTAFRHDESGRGWRWPGERGGRAPW